MALDLSGIGVGAAVLAGAVSFLSPCVLPLVPGYVSYITGQTVALDDGAVRVARHQQLRVILLSACFVLGFTSVFVALAAGANAVAKVFAAYRYEIDIIGGSLVILFGIITTGIWQPSWSQRDTRLAYIPVTTGPIPAYVLGMAFAFGWTPCIGPVLGAIIALSSSSTDAANGVLLLLAYSLGLGLPFVLSAVFLSGFISRLAKFRRVGRALKVFAGVVMILMGIAMVTGKLTSVAFWLLEMFPALSRIG